MTVIIVSPDPKRKWYGLALRHLRMASRLLDSGFSDGAFFHTYHAYECVLTSPKGTKVIGHYPSPKGGIQERSAHKARLIFFSELADATKAYFIRQASF